MRVRRLDKNGDWSFGQGQANYAKESEAVAQNVKTRILSFRNDWFMNINANIDWFAILASKQNKQTIVDEVRRVCEATYGVKSVNSVNLTDKDETSRSVSIQVDITTIFDEVITENIEVSYGY